MKKLMVCFLLSGSVLCASDRTNTRKPSSSSSDQTHDIPMFEEIRPKISLEDLLKNGPIGVAINYGHYHNEPAEKRIIHINRNPEARSFALELLLRGALETISHFCAHLGNDLYEGAKNLIVRDPAKELIKKINMAHVAHEAEMKQERERSALRQEALLITLIENQVANETLVRNLNEIAVSRKLTPEELQQLADAKRALANPQMQHIASAMAQQAAAA